MSDLKKLNQELEQHVNNHKQAPAPTLKKTAKKKERKQQGKPKKATRIPRTNQQIARVVTKNKKPDISDSEFAYWLKSLEYPSRYPEPVCPVGFNPVPSLFKTTARTYKTMLTFNVAANTQTSIYLYPGHGPNKFGFTAAPSSGEIIPNAMDGVAFHGNRQAVGTGPTIYAVGPIVVSAGGSCCGGIMQVGGIIGDIAASNTALSSYSALTYDRPLPYSTVFNTDIAAHGGHARWQQTSARIKVVNTTPALSRGGSIITVMPTNGGTLPDGAGAVLQMAANPSFFDHGPTMKPEGEGVSWLPRPQDIAFWHSVQGNNLAPSGTLQGVGLCCFIAAPNAAQTYDIQIDWNWQLSGDFLQGISTPNPTRNEHLAAVGTSVQIMQEGAKSAVGISGVHTAVADSAWHEAGAKVFNLAKTAIKEGFKAL